MTQPNKVTIIGTGSYAVALGKRLILSDYQVTFGSRNPNLKFLSECFPDHLEKFNVKTVSDAWNESSDVVFLAISAEDKVYESIVNEIKDSKPSKRILVDVSNKIEEISKIHQLSNAEKLKYLLTENKVKNITVIKGFNKISSYLLNADSIQERTIQICGDDSNAIETIRRLINSMGFQSNVVGNLSQALRLEEMNTTVFSDWYFPSIISFLFLVANFIWIFIHYFYFPKKPVSFHQYLSEFSLLGHLNKVLGFSALQLLSLVYFGSILASILQLCYGTKYKLFPKYFDIFLQNRKQYGLWAFLYASFHCVLTIFVTNPGYLTDWYIKSNDQFINFTKMTLIGEVNIILGVISYILFILVALSSINSIALSLNWKEWHFVQTKIGITCLFFGLFHTFCMYLNIFMQRYNRNFSVVYLVTRVKLLATIFPFFVLILRFLFAYFPPLSHRIKSIRNGSYETQNNVKKDK